MDKDSIEKEQQRNWVFTLNNPTEKIDSNSIPHLKYLVYQLEKGEEKGTPHYQGYIEFDMPIRFNVLKKILPTARWDIRKGTKDQARAYCMKENTRIDGPWEYGKWTKQGERSDLKRVAEIIKDDKLDQTSKKLKIFEEDPNAFLKYPRGINEALNLFTKAKKQETGPEVYILGGPSMAGKTSFVATNYPDYYLVPCDTNFFNGYNGESIIFFDEFKGNIGIDVVKQICQSFKFTLNTKQGFIHMSKREKIFFASNNRIENWWPNASREDMQAFHNRVTKYLLFWGKSHDYKLTEYNKYSDFLEDLVKINFNLF